MERSFYARTDSNSANNPALNLTSDPAVEITFVNQTATGSAGDLQLEQQPDGSPDPDTMVEIDGQLYSFTFELSGTMPTQQNQGAGRVPDQFEGDLVYVITVIDYPAPGDTTRLTFLPESGATQAEMDAFARGAISVQNLDTTPAPGPVCFAAGTAIATPGGAAPIEALGPGDKVQLAGGGTGRVLWAGHSMFVWPGALDRHKPVRIPEGALGEGLPHRPLIVSPQHRLPVSAGEGNTRVLVPAVALDGVRGIRRMRGCRQVAYHHLLLEWHACLIAEGAAAESLLPGPTALSMMAPRQAAGLRRVLAGLGTDYGPACLPTLTRRAAERLAAALGPGALLPA